MKPLRIVRAGPGDAAALLALETTFDSDRMSPRSVRHLLRSASARVWLARRGDASVGALVLLLRRNSGWARIYSVVVHPAHRGAGIGRRLIQAAERSARTEGRTGMTLEVRADNLPARRLYAALGYCEHAQLPGYYEDRAPGIRLRRPFGGARGTLR